MIAGIFHEGSGLGDQLFRYITVRTLAEEKGYEWGMVNPASFKGNDFMRVNLGLAYLTNNMKQWNEKDIRDAQGNDIRSYDPEINFVEDNTIIDGSFEDDKYWGHNLKNINEWLAVEPLSVSDDTCVLGFRGGEYYADSNLGLPKEYFGDAIKNIPVTTFNFQIHTDDPALARQIFPLRNFDQRFSVVENERISHSKHTNMGFNWRSARYAKYAIIPNSAFFILPRLLKHHEDPTAVTIAPRYWAGYNQKIWKRPATFYKPFTYI